MMPLSIMGKALSGVPQSDPPKMRRRQWLIEEFNFQNRMSRTNLIFLALRSHLEREKTFLSLSLFAAAALVSVCPFCRAPWRILSNIWGRGDRRLMFPQLGNLGLLQYIWTLQFLMLLHIIPGRIRSLIKVLIGYCDTVGTRENYYDEQMSQ